MAARQLISSNGESSAGVWTSPEAAFQAAQGAVAEQDWNALFGCFMPSSVRQLAAVSLRLLLGNDESRLRVFQGRHPDLSLAPLAAGEKAIFECSDPARRDLLVRAQEAAERRFLRSLPDPVPVAADLELFGHSFMGGGAVSRRLFQGETLQDVQICGDRARGTRYRDGKRLRFLEFALTGGNWRLKAGRRL